LLLHAEAEGRKRRKGGATKNEYLKIGNIFNRSAVNLFFCQRFFKTVSFSAAEYLNICT
jgi:hypothetical protein